MKKLGTFIGYIIAVMLVIMFLLVIYKLFIITINWALPNLISPDGINYLLSPENFNQRISIISIIINSIIAGAAIFGLISTANQIRIMNENKEAEFTPLIFFDFNLNHNKRELFIEVSNISNHINSIGENIEFKTNITAISKDGKVKMEDIVKEHFLSYSVLNKPSYLNLSSLLDGNKIKEIGIEILDIKGQTQYSNFVQFVGNKKIWYNLSDGTYSLTPFKEVEKDGKIKTNTKKKK